MPTANLAERPGAWAADPRTFDIADLDPRFLEDPFPTYAALRRHSPIHRNSDGTVLATRYAEVEFVLRDPRMSSDQREAWRARLGESPIAEHNQYSMVFRDPPDHTRIRKLVAHAFTPRAMALWEPRVVEAVDSLLDEGVKGGRMDLIGDFAYLLPLSVITAMMGVSPKERHRFRRWSAGVTGSLEPRPTAAQIAEGNAVVEDFKQFLGALADERRKTPGDDLMSLLVAAEQGGDRLTGLDLVHNAAFLLNAGHETTSNLVGNGINALFRFPDQLEALRREPALSGSAIEEMLRYDSPNQIGGRTPTAEIELAGVTIQPGHFIWISNGAANRDAAQFPDPDRFDIRRTPNRHVAFGYGIHTCLGAALARLEARVAIERLVTRFPKLRPDGQPTRRPRARHRGFSAYPVAVS
jgi:cytochrome P450